MKEKAACETVVPENGPSEVAGVSIKGFARGRKLTIEIRVLRDTLVQSNPSELRENIDVVVRSRWIRLKVKELHDVSQEFGQMAMPTTLPPETATTLAECSTHTGSSLPALASCPSRNAHGFLRSLYGRRHRCSSQEEGLHRRQLHTLRESQISLSPYRKRCWSRGSSLGWTPRHCGEGSHGWRVHSVDHKNNVSLCLSYGSKSGLTRPGHGPR